MKKPPSDLQVAKAFDVSPWVMGLRPRPKLARLRWRLRKVAPWMVWR